MGQAKRKGTFEERKAAAIDRQGEQRKESQSSSMHMRSPRLDTRKQSIIEAILRLAMGLPPQSAPSVGSTDADDFPKWWNKNHPIDWWASERLGKPLDAWTRVLVMNLARAAYEAGRKGQ